MIGGNSFTNCTVPDSPTALMAAGGEAPSAVHADPLSAASVAPVLQAARERWRAAGLTAEELRTLDAIAIEVTDLPGAMVGEARGSTIVLDRTAAGWGWFVDPTPFDDAEFGDGTAAGGAADRIDLLTTVAHEMLHVLGRADLDAALHPHDVMAGSLPRGVRRVPWVPSGCRRVQAWCGLRGTRPRALAARRRCGEITRAVTVEGGWMAEPFLVRDSDHELRIRAKGLGALQRATAPDQPESGAVLVARDDLRRRWARQLRAA